jgi:hypothetical protein
VCVERNICYAVLIPLLSLFQVRHFSLYFSLTEIEVSVHVCHYTVDVAAIPEKFFLFFKFSIDYGEATKNRKLIIVFSSDSFYA